MSMPLTESSDVRWFPVIVDRMARPRNNKIPWKLAEIVYTGYSQRYGTDQSLERIAERGGFGLIEMADYLGDKVAGLERQLAEAQGKQKRMRELASEAVCPDCIQKTDEACVDEGCNWGRQALAILGELEVV